MFDNFQPRLTEWEVELAISGAVTLERNSLVLQVLKGELAPFTTPATLSKNSQGIRCILVARAYDELNANDAAVYFVGQALDMLSLRLNIPLYLNLFRPEYRDLTSHVKRRVTEDEWVDAFRLGREYSLDRHYFSRAISWYRKGLVSDDPIDKLIAFWSALEAIGSRYFRDSERTRQGAINQVCDCFDQIWESSDRWQVIPNEPDVVNQFHRYRNGLSHGFIRVDIEAIRDIVQHLPRYQNLVHQFLLDWERNGYQIERQHREPNPA
jgi:hypothetical protein